MSRRFFKENDSKEYLAIELSTLSYYQTRLGRESYEARACAIENNITSVCTTEVSKQWLKENCTKVKKTQVPKDWLERF